ESDADAASAAARGLLVTPLSQPANPSSTREAVAGFGMRPLARGGLRVYANWLRLRRAGTLGANGGGTTKACRSPRPPGEDEGILLRLAQRLAARGAYLGFRVLPDWLGLL